MWADRPSGADENLLIERSIPPIRILSDQFREIQQNPHVSVSGKMYEESEIVVGIEDPPCDPNDVVRQPVFTFSL